MKYKFLQLILFSSIISINALAQPVIRWQKTIGGSNADDLLSMDLTKDCGYILGGLSFSNKSGEKTENSRGASDYWVVKLDSKGKIEWDKTVGGNLGDNLYSILQTTDEGYILGGFSNSNKSGDKTENRRGNTGNDYWIVKLDRFGNIEWDKTIGGNRDDQFRSLQQTSDGGYILGGWSASNASGQKTENSRGSGDYWIVKLDAMGKIQWDKTIGGNGQDECRSLQQTEDGGYILGGFSASDKSGEKTENSRGYADYWVVKLDSKGKIEWDKTVGGNLGDDVWSIQQTTDEGYILGGSSSSDKSGDKTENNRGWPWDDYWVVKLDKFGNIQWDKTIGGSDIDEIRSIQQTDDEGYILGGFSFSNQSGDKTENRRGNPDYWVVKLNKDGRIQWDKTIGGSVGQVCRSVKEIKRNHYVLGGYSSSGISGDKTQRSRGYSDYWIVKLVYQPGSPVIAESQNESNIVNPKTNSKNFTIYPNPAKDIVHVQISGMAIVSLTDQSGKVLLTTTISGSGIINVAGLKPGLYYLKNTTTGAVQKVIVSG